MDKKRVGIALLAVGIIVLILALAADLFGFGGSVGLGYKQIIGAVIGALIAIAGFVLMSRK